VRATSVLLQMLVWWLAACRHCPLLNAWPASSMPGRETTPPHLLGRLQAAHIAEVLEALPHHGALKGDQHDQGEEGVVPAGARRMQRVSSTFEKTREGTCRWRSRAMTKAIAEGPSQHRVDSIKRCNIVRTAPNTVLTSSHPEPTGRHRTPARQLREAAGGSGGRQWWAAAACKSWGNSRLLATSSSTWEQRHAYIKPCCTPCCQPRG